MALKVGVLGVAAVAVPDLQERSGRRSSAGRRVARPARATADADIAARAAPTPTGATRPARRRHPTRAASRPARAARRRHPTRAASRPVPRPRRRPQSPAMRPAAGGASAASGPQIAKVSQLASGRAVTFHDPTNGDPGVLIKLHDGRSSHSTPCAPTPAARSTTTAVPGISSAPATGPRSTPPTRRPSSPARPISRSRRSRSMSIRPAGGSRSPADLVRGRAVSF